MKAKSKKTKQHTPASATHSDILQAIEDHAAQLQALTRLLSAMQTWIDGTYQDMENRVIALEKKPAVAPEEVDLFNKILQRVDALEWKPSGEAKLPYTTTIGTYTKVEPTKPSLPDPDKLEGNDLWQAVETEVGSIAGRYTSSFSKHLMAWTPYRDLGELIGVMFTKYRARFFHSIVGNVIWLTAKDERENETAIIDGDLASTAARAALKFVRNQKP